MYGVSRKLFIAALFAAILIIVVNVVWWLFYSRTVALLDQQLSRRLAAIAKTSAISLSADLIDNIRLGDLETYAQVVEILESVRLSDSLAEVFILDENYNYLATTSIETDSTYFLAELNGKYIDSLIFRLSEQAIATPSYKTGDIHLKSAFAPLPDTFGYVRAVLGVEANVDYFDVLVTLKNNLYYSSGLSVLGGVVFGMLFLYFQRRVSIAEQQLFLNQTHAYLGRMVAVVSHEIKNPLMIIRASAERLLKKNKSAEGTFIVEEADRLNDIVTGYLDFAKAGGSILAGDRLEPINLSELVSDIRRHLEQKYADTQVHWIDGEVPTNLVFSAYRRSLRQVLLNLLINGAESCLSASKQIKVGITVSDKSGMVTISVLDYGPGFSKKDLKRVFTPFYTTKQSGSGLGLYLSKRIVSEMGGDVRIESSLGSKTEVIITLPKTPKS
ncbi:MAG: PAS domain-containing sensor histidine kinase [Candidatus Zixiibacteriota bacterium]